jgi:predicted aldo/keto reductase-like oxidoreductase
VWWTLNLLITINRSFDGVVYLQYRHFGKLDWEVSVLGFGTMRLPLNSEDHADINVPEATRLIRAAIDHGVNYVDTAYVYHEGQSEAVVGEALQDGYREKVKIATKMPVFSVESKSDLDRVFEAQLKRLRTDCIDFYLLHALMAQTWQKAQELDILGWAERKVAEGKIGHLGFSFHDEYEVFREIVDAYDWTFCQIQYNYLDEHYQAGIDGLRYAAGRGLAVAVMEPLAGGLLAVQPPADIQSEWDMTGVKRSPADWALRWVWNHPEVATALSGMNSMMQLQENLASAEASGANTLTPTEISALSKSRELFQSLGYIGCSKCRYCSHCPQSIDIPVTLAFLNEYASKRREPEVQEHVKERYLEAVPSERRADSCIRCGQCEQVCPQHLPVRKLISEAAAAFL